MEAAENIVHTYSLHHYWDFGSLKYLSHLVLIRVTPFILTYSPQQGSCSDPEEHRFGLLPNTDNSRAGNNPEPEVICILKVQFIPLHPFSVIPHIPTDTRAPSGAHLLENTPRNLRPNQRLLWVRVAAAAARVWQPPCCWATLLPPPLPFHPGEGKTLNRTSQCFSARSVSRSSLQRGTLSLFLGAFDQEPVLEPGWLGMGRCHVSNTPGADCSGGLSRPVSQWSGLAAASCDC